jgi:hypothetical protein
VTSAPHIAYLITPRTGFKYTQVGDAGRRKYGDAAAAAVALEGRPAPDETDRRGQDALMGKRAGAGAEATKSEGKLFAKADLDIT